MVLFSFLKILIGIFLIGDLGQSLELWGDTEASNWESDSSIFSGDVKSIVQKIVPLISTTPRFDSSSSFWQTPQLVVEIELGVLEQKFKLVFSKMMVSELLSESSQDDFFFIFFIKVVSSSNFMFEMFNGEENKSCNWLIGVEIFFGLSVVVIFVAFAGDGVEQWAET